MYIHIHTYVWRPRESPALAHAARLKTAVVIVDIIVIINCIVSSSMYVLVLSITNVSMVIITIGMMICMRLRAVAAWCCRCCCRCCCQ